MVEADKREVVDTVLVSGTLVARDDVLVAPEIEGLVVTEILVDEGSAVKKGQVLARLNAAALNVQLQQNRAQLARLDAALSQSEAQIAEAEANKVQANNSFNRAVQLQASGSTSAEIFDQKAGAARAADARRTAATHALAMTSAERSSLLATLDDTQLKISRTEIKAPMAGIVARKNIKLGSVATSLGDPLFKIIGDGAIELEAEVSEVDLPKLKAGQKVEVAPAGTGQALGGAIRLVSPEIDKSTRLGRIRVSLPQSAIAFVGAFARGKVETARSGAITVPISAVTYRSSGPMLQVVTGDAVQTRPVKISSVSDGRASVASGLAEGETVILRQAGTFLRDGDIVSVIRFGTVDRSP